MEIIHKKDKSIYLLFHEVLREKRRLYEESIDSTINNFCISTGIEYEIEKAAERIPGYLYTEIFTNGVLYYNWWDIEVARLQPNIRYLVNQYINKSKLYLKNPVTDITTRLKIYMIQEMIDKYPTVNKKSMFPGWAV